MHVLLVKRLSKMTVESLHSYRSKIIEHGREVKRVSLLVVEKFPRNCTLPRNWKKRVTRIAGSELVFRDQYSSNFLPSVITICFSARPTYFPRSVAPLLRQPSYATTFLNSIKQPRRSRPVDRDPWINADSKSAAAFFLYNSTIRQWQENSLMIVSRVIYCFTRLELRANKFLWEIPGCLIICMFGIGWLSTFTNV